MCQFSDRWALWTRRRAPREMIASIKHLQLITHQGRLAAVVIAEQAIIDDTLPPEQHQHVQAMCLYALQISEHERPGPYTDADAETYARHAARHD